MPEKYANHKMISQMIKQNFKLVGKNTHKW